MKSALEMIKRACLYGGYNFTVGCQKTMGGVLNAYIANLSEVTLSFETDENDPLFNAIIGITLISGAYIYGATPIPTTGSATSAGQGVGGGGAVNYLNTVAMQLTPINQLSLNAYDRLVGARVVVFMQMREVVANLSTRPNQWIAIGYDGGLLATTASASTGAADADLSGYTLELTGTETRPMTTVAIGGDYAATTAALEALAYPSY